MTPAILISWFLAYKYFFIFVIVVIEGPIITTLSGLLLHLNYVHLWPIYLTLVAGDLTADMIWYVIGRYGAYRFARKYGRYVGVTEALLTKTEALFKHHQNKILFFSKITMGFGFALVVLMSAGMARVSFKKYMALNTLGQFIWTGFLLSIGYFFGKFYLVINKDLQRLSLFAFIIVVMAALHGFRRYWQSRNIVTQL